MGRSIVRARVAREGIKGCFSGRRRVFVYLGWSCSRVALSCADHGMWSLMRCKVGFNSLGGSSSSPGPRNEEKELMVRGVVVVHLDTFSIAGGRSQPFTLLRLAVKWKSEDEESWIAVVAGIYRVSTFLQFSVFEESFRWVFLEESEGVFLVN